MAASKVVVVTGGSRGIGAASAVQLAEQGWDVCSAPPTPGGLVHASSGEPQRAQRMAPSIPMRRAGEASEVAFAVAWLCSGEASHVTGALLDVSGGR